VDGFNVNDLKTSLHTVTIPSVEEDTVEWGFSIRPEQPRLRCMKLLLDPGQDIPAFVSRSEMREQLAMSGKTATAVVADYLHEIYKHVEAELHKRFGKEFVEVTDLQWILTVPAVWSDAAKSATLTAAKKAGLGPDITLISEPEAAAVYTLQAVQPNYLNEGDNFVVVDAGGGTVDLISYVSSAPFLPA
jgi:molecular chaperone DnaK (HSP70)